MTSTNNYYQLYLGKVIDLAATIVIKSEDTAEAMNNYLSAVYGTAAVDLSDPASWRYYKNLAGEYHYADEPMSVVSMDTLQPIAFTKENLEIHRATSRAYQYGSREYRELLSRYPKQRMLILGILYPIDISAAIAAKDAEILGYPPGLVEVNEYSFIESLQDWVFKFRNRWYNRAYTVVDNLYLSAHLGVMYALLPQAILTLRLDRCKTNEAHSFHIRQYLTSHGFLDSYYDNLSTKQALQLYRNILYLERNPGQRHIFSWLTDKLLTQRALPLAEFTMRHDTTTQVDDLTPEIFFKRKELNLGFSYDTLDRITLEQMLTKENPKARDNPKIEADVAPVIQEQMENSGSNILQTKALESAMVDYTDASPYTLDETLMSHWVWLAHRGLYTAFINIENPRTGERIVLSAKDAFALMFYAFCKSIGFTLDEIPPFFANHVQRLPIPQPAELMSVVDPARVDIATAKWLLSYQPVIQNLISSEAFYNKAKEIWRCKNTQYNIVAWQEHHIERGMVDNMMNRCYADVMCDLFPGENYTAWFAARNLDFSAFTREEFATMSLSLVRAATGLDLLTSNSVSSLQKAMVGLMEKLSSYSVQFMSYINEGAIVPLGWPVLRLGDLPTHVNDHWYVPHLNVRLQQFFTKFKERIQWAVNDGQFNTWLNVQQRDQYRADNTALIALAKSPAQVFRYHDEIGVQIGYTEEPPEDTEGVFPVLGIASYLALTAEQRSHFKDIYGSTYNDRP